MRLRILKGPRIARSLHPGWVRVSEVKAGEVTWLWRGMIPARSFSIIEGLPGCGKSTIIRDIAARVTTGRDMPFGSPPCPGSVLWVSSEEDLSTIIKPRLQDAGANEELVYSVGEDGWAVARTSIEAMATENNVRLIVLDNLMALVQPEADDYLTVQKCMAPWIAIASACGAALVGIRHFRKSGARNAVSAGIGSIGWSSVARATLVVGKVGGRRAIALGKSNLAPVGDPYSFELTPDGRIVWGEEMPGVSPDDITDPDSEVGKGKRKPTAVDLLREYLSSGPKTRAECLEHLGLAGYKPGTVDNAASRLGCHGINVWRLTPDEDDQ